MPISLFILLRFLVQTDKKKEINLFLCLPFILPFIKGEKVIIETFIQIWNVIVHLHTFIFIVHCQDLHLVIYQYGFGLISLNSEI